MKILVTGSTGLIGSQLVPALQANGHTVVRLARTKRFSAEPEILWNPVARILDPRLLNGFDAVVHLAGDPIAQGRWTAEKKALIRDSRVKGTRFFCETLAQAETTPASFVAASAIGIYGDRGEELLTEDSALGRGFFAQMGQEWEQACESALLKGARVVNLRFGVVLSPTGGALKEMLPTFRMGLGGSLGNGRQWMSWVSLEDAVAAIQHAIATPSLSGPVNVVSPNPVRNLEFSRTLARALRRPALLRVPAPVVRLLFGGLADETVLASTRVEPKRLKSSGFRFVHRDLETALRSLLG